MTSLLLPPTTPAGNSAMGTITATWFSVTRTATVTLTPGAPAPAHRVAIRNATWDAGLLTIQATSTNPKVITVRSNLGGSATATLTND
ncbi:MAG: hypothetical protein E6I52_13895 [Chloroflexi bacterium]|nr:MAG: hypothetical protein E6I52_13895 [Chloroflexota bacterium]